MRRQSLAVLIAAVSVAALTTPALARMADPAPALVQPPAQSGQPPQKDAAGAASDLDRIVCKPRQATGSRLPSSKVCRTKREWNQLELEQRRDLEKMQDSRGLKSGM
jgi:hypothetical protein